MSEMITEIRVATEPEALHILRNTDHDYVLMRCGNDLQHQAIKNFTGDLLYIDNISDNIKIDAYAVSRYDLLNDRSLDICAWYANESDLRLDRTVGVNDKYFVAGRDIEERLQACDGVIVCSSREMFIGAELPDAYYSYQFDCAVIGKQRLAELYKHNEHTKFKDIIENYTYYADLKNYLKNNELSKKQKQTLLMGVKINDYTQNLIVIYDFSENDKISSWYRNAEGKKELRGEEAARFLDRVLAVDQGISGSPVKELGYDKTYFEIRIIDGDETLSSALRLDLDGMVFGTKSSEIETFGDGLELLEPKNNKLVAHLKNICRDYRINHPDHCKEDRNCAVVSLKDYVGEMSENGALKDLDKKECLFAPKLPMSYDFVKAILECNENERVSFYENENPPVFKLSRNEIVALFDSCYAKDDCNNNFELVTEFNNGLLFKDLASLRQNSSLSEKERNAWFSEVRQQLLHDCISSLKNDSIYNNLKTLNDPSKKQTYASFNLKAELKNTFPGVKFSVRVHDFDLYVTFGDSNLSKETINQICSKYSSVVPNNFYERNRKEAFNSLFGSVYGSVYASYDPLLNKIKEKSKDLLITKQEDEKRIYVKPDLTNDDREILKQIPGHKYNPKTHVWSVGESAVKQHNEKVINRILNMKCYICYGNVFKGKEMTLEEKSNLFFTPGKQRGHCY